MTEYEAATLAIRHANLGVACGQTAASVAIGPERITALAWGIHAMQRAGTRRARCCAGKIGEASYLIPFDHEQAISDEGSWGRVRYAPSDRPTQPSTG